MMGERKILLIYLKEISFEKLEGGINLPNFSLRNKEFGGKLIWFMYDKAETKWCKIMQRKYLDTLEPSHIFTMENIPKGSPIWNFMVS